MVIHRGLSTAKVGQKITRDLDERVLIGTLGINCLNYTRRCIETVKTRAKHVTFLYIDNGSKPENIQQIEKWKKNNDNIDEFYLAFNGYNAGVAVGWNQIIKYGIENGYDKILICNNDIAFGPHTIDGMVVGFNSIKSQVPETVMVTATNMSKNPADLASIKPDGSKREHPDFSCFMIEPSFVEKIGYICEDYKPAFFEDNDTHWRILLTGYKAFSTNLAPYSHIASRTRYENPDLVTHTRFRANRIQFMRNHLTKTVDQKVADARYAHWLSKNPSVKHPAVKQVQDLALADGLIDGGMIEYLNNLTIMTVQME